MTRNQLEYMRMQEDKRANLARETETKRSNMAVEGLTAWRDQNTIALRDRELAETARANLERESQGRQSLMINLGQLEETKRANLAREAETNRTNLAHEAIGRTQAGAAWMQAEASRTNALTRINELSSLNAFRQEQLKDADATRMEQQRHNQAMESIDRVGNSIRQQQANTQDRSVDETVRHNQQTEWTQNFRTGADIGLGLVGNLSKVLDIFG